MVEDPTGFHLGLSYLSRTLPLCIGGASRPLTALMTMILASLNFLPLYTSLKVEEVAPLEMGTIGPMGDMTFAGFLTTALKFHLMKAR